LSSHCGIECIGSCFIEKPGLSLGPHFIDGRNTCITCVRQIQDSVKIAQLLVQTIMLQNLLCSPFRVSVYQARSIANAIIALYAACMRAAVAVEFDRHRRSAYSVPIPKNTSH
jgi:hypothetical protein